MVGGIKAQLHLFLTWHKLEGSIQLHAVAALPLGKNTPIPTEYNNEWAMRAVLGCHCQKSNPVSPAIQPITW
jgi:hypothetical protein